MEKDNSSCNLMRKIIKCREGLTKGMGCAIILENYDKSVWELEVGRLKRLSHT